MTALAIASFAAPEPTRAAIRKLLAQQRHIVGVWSPVPFEETAPQAANRRPVGWLMALAGCLSAASFYGLISWTAIAAYSFDSGGRPLYSWPAFLVAPIEFGALVAAAAGVALFFYRARLTRLHDSAFDLAEVGQAMQDRLVIAVRCDAGEDANDLIALLASGGALSTRIVLP